MRDDAQAIRVNTRQCTEQLPMGFRGHEQTVGQTQFSLNLFLTEGYRLLYLCVSLPREPFNTGSA